MKGKKISLMQLFVMSLERDYLIMEGINFACQEYKETATVYRVQGCHCMYKYSVIFYLRSGHLQELGLPLKVMVQKKKVLDQLKIADSLKKVVLEEIDVNQYKKIDKILPESNKVKLENILKIYLNIRCIIIGSYIESLSPGLKKC